LESDGDRHDASCHRRNGADRRRSKSVEPSTPRDHRVRLRLLLGVGFGRTSAYTDRPIVAELANWSRHRIPGRRTLAAHRIQRTSPYPLPLEHAARSARMARRPRLPPIWPSIGPVLRLELLAADAPMLALRTQPCRYGLRN